MIRAKLNLVCSKGHRHYAPEPEVFVGRGCFYPTEKGDTRKKCQEPLRLIKGKP